MGPPCPLAGMINRDLSGSMTVCDPACSTTYPLLRLLAPALSATNMFPDDDDSTMGAPTPAGSVMFGGASDSEGHTNSEQDQSNSVESSYRSKVLRISEHMGNVNNYKAILGRAWQGMTTAATQFKDANKYNRNPEAMYIAAEQYKHHKGLYDAASQLVSESSIDWPALPAFGDVALQSFIFGMPGRDNDDKNEIKTRASTIQQQEEYITSQMADARAGNMRGPQKTRYSSSSQGWAYGS